MVWTQEYQLFVLCGRPSESNIQRLFFCVTVVLTTWVVVIFRVKWFCYYANEPTCCFTFLGETRSVAARDPMFYLLKTFVTDMIFLCRRVLLPSQCKWLYYGNHDWLTASPGNCGCCDYYFPLSCDQIFRPRWFVGNKIKKARDPLRA